MLPKSVIKTGIENTRLGTACVLLVDDVRVLAFPECINRYDSQDIDRYHPTLIWPEGVPLQSIVQFPSGPALPGWDILGAYDGGIGENPWAEHGIKSDNPIELASKNPSMGGSYDTLPTSTSTFRTIFDCADKALQYRPVPRRFHHLLLRLRISRVHRLRRKIRRSVRQRYK